MKCLLLIAHGSRRENSNQEVRQLVENIAACEESVFDEVTVAFLELASPSILDGLESCIKQGATEIVVFPYFLAAGRHVVEDIPAEVMPVREKYPEVQIYIAPHLGFSLDLPQIILDIASDENTKM